MSEQDTSQERTEQATPKRLQDARKKGQAPRSRELNTTAVVLTGAGAMLVFGSSIGSGMLAAMRQGLSPSRELAFETGLLASAFGAAGLEALVLLAPLLMAVLAAALIGPALLGGLIFSAEAMKPKLEKLDPVKGLKRIFSANGLMEFAKTLAKFVVVAGAGGIVLWQMGPELLAAGESDVATAVPGLARAMSWVLVLLGAVLLLIAAVDVPFQLWTHSKQLRMTRQEVRDEMKETDGRPEVKGRIRRIQMEMAQRRMMAAIPTADVVITNPTHFAVALKYDSGSAAAPRVVAKGVEEVALRIREAATEAGVPRLEAPPLARALYYTTPLDQEIPEELFLAVARVLAWVYQLRAAAPGDPAPELADLEVPEYLTRRRPGTRI